MSDDTLLYEWWEILDYNGQRYYRKTPWQTHRQTEAAT